MQLQIVRIIAIGGDQSGGICFAMYVCICNRYRDSAIRDAANKSGHRDAPALYESLGCAAKCGRCLEMAQDLIDDVHAGAPALAHAHA